MLCQKCMVERRIDRVELSNDGEPEKIIWECPVCGEREKLPCAEGTGTEAEKA